MRDNVTSVGVTWRKAPIECPGTIAVVQRYDAPLEDAYEKHCSDMGREILYKDSPSTPLTAQWVQKDCAQCASFWCYSATGKVHTCATPDKAQRAIEGATRAAEKEQAKRRIAFRLRFHGNAQLEEHSKLLECFPTVSKVLVLRKPTSSGNGPFPFIGVGGNTAVVPLPNRRRIFRTTCVRTWQERFINPLIKEYWYEEPAEESIEGGTTEVGKRGEDEGIRTDFELEALVKGGTVRTRNLSTLPERIRDRISASIRTEHNGLIENGTFRPVYSTSVPNGNRVFRSIFVDEQKRADVGVLFESRIVAQNYAD